MEEFGSRKTRVKWDRPTGEILKALNEHGSVSGAAKALGTTSVTLAKAMERHHLVQRWMVEDANENPESNGKGRGRPRRRPQAKYLWPE